MISLDERERLEAHIKSADDALTVARAKLSALSRYAKELTLEPCRMCSRRVASPCNDAAGYYEGGPWDGACEGLVKGHAAVLE